MLNNAPASSLSLPHPSESMANGILLPSLKQFIKSVKFLKEDLADSILDNHKSYVAIDSMLMWQKIYAFVC